MHVPMIRVQMVYPEYTEVHQVVTPPSRGDRITSRGAKWYVDRLEWDADLNGVTVFMTEE